MKIKISDIGEIITGRTPSSNCPEDFGDDVLFVTPSDNFDNTFIEQTVRKLSKTGSQKLSSKLLPIGSIMVTCIGSNMGKIAINLSPSITNQQINSIVVKTEKYNRRYVYYKLRDSYQLFRKAVGAGTSVPILNKTNFGEIIIDVHANKTEQKKIADILTAIDEKIALNKRINSELEAMAKTIYTYWFMQFDFPNEEGKPYKTSGGEMEWNEDLRREIPKGWRCIKIGEYAEVRKGYMITAKDSEEGTIKVVSAGIDYSFTHSKSNREENTITVSGSGANAGYINFWREPIFASDCITIRGETDTETLLLLHFLRFSQTRISNMATGSAQPHVYPDYIKNLKCIAPDAMITDEFGKVVIPMNKQIANNINQTQELVRLRDFLLPLLMNGQVKVV